MVGALFVVVLFLGFFSVYLRNCSETNAAGNGGGGQNQNGGSGEWPCSCTEGIDRKVLDSFPILVYSSIKELKIGKGSLECAVCLSEFKDFDTLRLLPKCNHVFHPDCIDAWLSSHVTCPVCREKLNNNSADSEVVVAVTVQTESPHNHETNDEEEKDNTEQRAEQHENLVNEEGESSVKSGDVYDDDDYSGKGLRGRLLLMRRSNSTGHCEVEEGGGGRGMIMKNNDNERYRLRLPEDVRRYILLNHGTMMRRSVSHNVIMPMGGSTRKGLCENENVENWVVSRPMPPATTSPLVSCQA